jgi:hypothetical protein
MELRYIHLYTGRDRGEERGEGGSRHEWAELRVNL